MTTRYEYDAWGNYLGGSGVSYNAIGYTGQRFDSETGLMPLGNGERYYPPGLGSFIQQDSFTGMAMMAQSMNRYAYAHNNPLKFTDPSRHEGEDPDALWHLAKGLGKGIFNIVSEPFRQAADVATVIGARAMGIDAEDVQLSSALGRGEQRAVLAGQDPSTVVASGVKSAAYFASTLGLGPLTESVGGNILAYHDDRITLAEYNERMGEDLSNALAIYALWKVAGKSGEAAPEVATENPNALATGLRRLQTRPLARPEPFQPELPFEPAANVGPRQPSLFEGAPEASASAAAEESVVAGASRQMRLPFEGPEPEQISLPFEEPKLGGAYRDIPANGGEVHHMPANSVSPLSKGSGPGIRMDTLEHRQTASWGSSRQARAYRARQQELIDQGRFHEAQQMDILDVRSKFGSKYEPHIRQMQEYTEQIDPELLKPKKPSP